METKNQNQQQENIKKTQKQNRPDNDQDDTKSRIFNAGELKGVDHTLTPGQNPLPDDSEDKNKQYNENEKIDESNTLYAQGADRKKQQNDQRTELNERDEEDEEDEDEVE